MFGLRFKTLMLLFHVLLLLTATMTMMACGDSRKIATDGPLEEDVDTIFEDTLVYDLPDDVVTEGVDENFMDFIYNFIHNKRFQLQRLAYPVPVHDVHGEEVATIKSGRTFTAEFDVPPHDYYVLLLNPQDDPYDCVDREPSGASLHIINLLKGKVQIFQFEHQERWLLTSVDRLRLHEHHLSDFLGFYRRFSADTLYMADHLAREISISIPDPDEEVDDIVEGNIDAEQWPVFSPELPTGILLMLSYYDMQQPTSPLNMVKCGVATSMMEILTFDRFPEGWLLTGFEER